MNKKRIAALTLATALLATSITGCGSTEDKTNSDTISGEITVLTNRTDIVDKVFRDEYLPKFNEKYPDVKVTFEALTDYSGDIKIRMNTSDYGDVLLIPDDVPISELPDFFESLGSTDELSEKYMFVNEKSYDEKVYGIAQTGNAQGIVYNKKVFEGAGITELPTTPEDFVADMQKIKDKYGDEVVPYYTNYAAGWPLTQWESDVPCVAGDPDYASNLYNLDAPFAEGEAHYVVYKLMYDLVKNGLVEKDPTTADWESSKVDLATGKIGTMVLGSWSISQMQEKADDPSDIGYMPFPSNIDGNVYASVGGDYKVGINVNSKNKEAARAWLDWFINESGYAQANGGISPVKGDALPENLSDFTNMGVKLIENNPAPAGKENLTSDIDNEAQIGLWQDDFKRRIIEAGLFGEESFDDIASDLNNKWKTAKEKVTE
ncbi:MAG: ABC transporter substrate-binding protein [Clostridiaceae bacterium]